MNICIVTQRYPYEDNMEFVFVKKLVDEWTKMGHRCVVVAEFPWQVYLRGHIQYKPTHYRDEVAPDIFVDVYNPRTLNIPGAGKLNFLWGRLNCQKAFDYFMDKLGIKFDFLYCHFLQPSVFAFAYAKGHNIPFFVATGESEILSLKIPFKSFTLDEYRNYTSGVIAVSSKNRKEASDLNIIDSSKCEVFPNGTDLNVFNRKDKIECRKKLGLPLDSFIVVSVGYFCTRKGQNRVLAAIDKLKNPSIKSIFIGKEAAVDRFVLEGDSILFKGSVVNSHIPDYLNAADVFCLPTRFEGCCNAVIEAMACGCPIISSDCSFNYDVLNSTNSILVDPDDVDRIAEAIKLLYENKGLRESLANKAYEDSRSLGIKQRAKDILSFIETKIHN